MDLKSSAFKHEGKIPSLYTCDGENINPPLEINQVPKNAKSLVLIMDDPDVPKSRRPDGLFVHWVIYNMPPETTKLAENATPPGIQGTGTHGKANYFGPCPPDREHRYFIKLYAIDTVLKLNPGSTKEEVEQAIKGHVIEETALMGTYVRITK
ncbi:MAG TPA: YbhB/YbcL family Raf kinase inhibitor-like protein [Rhabdochlamydiaceae bacterium]|jgi:Raf kinase inhibitor-like YbhB/YbcL family protein|nr:YbhB/YbcL family Raf kinase inhibitor-like protein [Rhabdochlamydiaceae bacterium]